MYIWKKLLFDMIWPYIIILYVYTEKKNIIVWIQLKYLYLWQVIVSAFWIFGNYFFFFYSKAFLCFWIEYLIIHVELYELYKLYTYMAISQQILRVCVYHM